MFLISLSNGPDGIGLTPNLFVFLFLDDFISDETSNNLKGSEFI
jgi:hypothetical protein